MRHNGADVALLTERRYEASVAADGDWYLGNILRDDQLLRDALQIRGLTAMRIDWARPEVDWSRFRCAVFRTTWDYFERFTEFSAWLAQVEPQVQLINDASLVRWNSDKRYLADLSVRGIPVVPSHFVQRGNRSTLHELLDATGWADTVIKPCVSGSARHTYRLNRTTADSLEPVFRELVAAESFLLQPFQRDVAASGEDTLMVFDGRFSHAVRKVPKAGDFRVQDDHGGTVYEYVPTREQIELAERAIAVRDVPAYGRVDMIRDNEGRLAVMELELIEPELWLRHHPPAATAFADAIVRRLES
ncbi:MAG: hypothetical protein U0746_13700 [Gemmataceae bacterium]